MEDADTFRNADLQKRAPAMHMLYHLEDVPQGVAAFTADNGAHLLATAFETVEDRIRQRGVFEITGHQALFVCS